MIDDPGQGRVAAKSGRKAQGGYHEPLGDGEEKDMPARKTEQPQHPKIPPAPLHGRVQTGHQHGGAAEKPQQRDEPEEAGKPLSRTWMRSMASTSAMTSMPWPLSR